MQDFKLKVGDCWNVKNTPNGHITITRIDEVDNEKIIHVAYQDSECEVQHLPVSAEQILLSIGKKTGENEVTKEHLEGIQYWEDDAGGVWDLEMSEIIEIVFNTDDYDEVE